MKYGCIGEHLSHSFSKEIHAALSDYEYKIHEVAREALDKFMTERDFLGINVTIPYKEAVIPHLYYIDDSAKAIGAVNTVVNREGRLYGYNTDFYGVTKLLSHAKISLEGKKVAILGTGGTSKTVFAVARSLNAEEIIKVSRSEKPEAVTYEEFYTSHADTEIIINTTPVGMYPRSDEIPIDISKFPKLSGVVDMIYNPLRTRLVLAAREHGISAVGGLYMLVAQAVRASEIFLDTTYPDGTIDSVYGKILKSKENVVLIGMPSCGKSTVGKIIAEALGRETVDTDSVISERAKISIPDIFEKYGEKYFRDLESEAIRDTSYRASTVISTGGGAPIRAENILLLKQNGRIYFIDRPLSSLTPTDDRPLSRDRAAIEERFIERYPIYLKSCDTKIGADGTPQDVAEKILEDFRT